MKATCLSTLLLFTYFQLISQPKKLPIDASHSVISFSVGFAGDVTNIEGRFDKFTGEVGYSVPNDRSTFFANVEIDVSSLNTGDSERDNDLMGEDYFNSNEYPNITFKSTSTTQTADGFLLNGEFEMLGVKKELSIPFEFTHETQIAWVFGEPRIGTKGNTLLSRKDFSIPKRGWNSMIPTLGSMMLNDNIEVRLVIQGVGQGLSEIIKDEIEIDGVQAGIDKYKELKEGNEGKLGYSFGASTLARIGMALSKKEKVEDGLTIAEFATKEYPDDFFGFYALGTIYMEGGQNKKAEKNFEKTLKLNPNLERVKQLLNKLKSE